MVLTYNAITSPPVAVRVLKSALYIQQIKCYSIMNLNSILKLERAKENTTRVLPEMRWF
jgi:hypothetical protein